MNQIKYCRTVLVFAVFLWAIPAALAVPVVAPERECPQITETSGGKLLQLAALDTTAPTSEPQRNCREPSSCCRVCSGGKACGNSCIRRDYTCRKGRGCACNSSELCR